MRRWLLVASFQACLLLFNPGSAHADADSALTALEQKWLRAGASVLNYADAQHLPIDVVVQPQSSAGDVPLAMGVDEGRCKLVLSMRGNPDAETTIVDLPNDLQAIAIEAMIAHEVAHCWRYTHGMWHALPAGFIEATETSLGAELAAKQKAMRETRREEAFADLVGLAWTLREHPAQYAAIHAWFTQVRADQPATGGYHDTREWLNLAAQPRFPAGTPFEQANQLWLQGLLQH